MKIALLNNAPTNWRPALASLGFSWGVVLQSCICDVSGDPAKLPKWARKVGE